MRTITYIAYLAILMLNMFILELEQGRYYLLIGIANYFLVFLLSVRDFKKLDKKSLNFKYLKLIHIISIVSILVIAASVFIPRPFQYRDISITIFTFLNTIMLMIYIFKYEMKK